MCEGYRNKILRHLHEHRSLMGAILREQPKKLYYLPGDHEGLEMPIKSEDIKEMLKKTGNKELLNHMGLNG
jgi:hypothetical protein